MNRWTARLLLRWLLRAVLLHLREHLTQPRFLFGMLPDRFFDRARCAGVVIRLGAKPCERDPGFDEFRIVRRRRFEHRLRFLFLAHLDANDRLISLRARLVRIFREHGGRLFERADEVLAIEVRLRESDARVVVVGVVLDRRFELLDGARRRFWSGRFVGEPDDEDDGGDGADAVEEAC